MTYTTAYFSLSSLTVYRGILDTEIGQSLSALLAHQCTHDSSLHANATLLSQYSNLCFLLQRGGFSGLGDFFLSQLTYMENPYADAIAQGTASDGLTEGAQRDISILAEIAATLSLHDSLSALLEAQHPLPTLSNDVPFTFQDITQSYHTKGCGIFAQYRTFLWDNGGLVPVPHPDCPRPIELMGYSLQRNKVLENTRSLIAGNRVNNVLLFGNGGTGKSATVKSMLYQQGFDSLRLIEIAKEGLENLSSLTRMLGRQPQKFILFIDDLAFDKDDKTYSSLKSILEGGLEPRPKNVAVYATSNRRHLVKQTISDRAGDEMDTFETIAEKTALADRFGLRIPYLTMNKVEFLQLVSHLAGLKKLDIPEGDLHAQAMTWEIRHGGRTPRTAQQFISSLK